MMYFKHNVNEFWQWFQRDELIIREMLRQQDTNRLIAELSQELNKVFGDMAFLIGGKEGAIELILSPEGNRDKVYLSRFWQEQSPTMEGWAFFHLKPPGGHMSFNLKIDGSDISLNPDDFCLALTLDSSNKKIDLEVYCEKLTALEEQLRYRFTFLMLDECLGEGYVETAIGGISLTDKKTPLMIPMNDIYKTVERTFREKLWQLHESPDKVFTVYHNEPKEDAAGYRDDIISGYTSNVNLIPKFTPGKADSLAYMRSVGADYVFLAYDHAEIPQPQRIQYRGEIEDAIDAMLGACGLGYHIGGATGTNYSYIDLLIFNIEEFKKQLSDVLGSFAVTINCLPFTAEV